MDFNTVFRFLLYFVVGVVVAFSIVKSFIKYYKENKNKRLVKYFFDSDGNKKNPFGTRNYSETSQMIDVDSEDAYKNRKHNKYDDDNNDDYEECDDDEYNDEYNEEYDDTLMEDGSDDFEDDTVYNYMQKEQRNIKDNTGIKKHRHY